MKSVTTENFRECYSLLPAHIKRAAQKAYRTWKKNPNHPSLKFKQVHPTDPIFSVRISLGYRAIGVQDESTMIWYWIGSHNDYEVMLKKL